jgi:hypothetical protein
MDEGEENSSEALMAKEGLASEELRFDTAHLDTQSFITSSIC